MMKSLGITRVLMQDFGDSLLWTLGFGNFPNVGVKMLGLPPSGQRISTILRVRAGLVGDTGGLLGEPAALAKNPPTCIYKTAKRVSATVSESRGG